MEEKKKSKLGLGIIIGLLIAAVVGLGTYVVFDKVISNDKNDNNESKVIEPTTIPEEKETKDKIVIENVFSVISEKGTYKQEYKILLGDKVRTLSVEFTKNENVVGPMPENFDAVYMVDDKVLEKLENCLTLDGPFLDYTDIYVINNDVLVLVGGNGISAYDKKLNKINLDLDTQLNAIDPGMREEHFYEGTDFGTTQVVGNKILFYATRSTDLLGTTDRIYYKDGVTKIFDDNCNMLDEYKNLDYDARYEIEYLGNGNFSNVKKNKTLSTVGKMLMHGCYKGE